MKTCSKCKKLNKKYRADKRAKDGLQSQCTDCINAAKRTPEYRLKIKEYRQRPEAQERRRIDDRNKGKLRRYKYLKTEKGSAMFRAARARYDASPLGQVMNALWAQDKRENPWRYA